MNGWWFSIYEFRKITFLRHLRSLFGFWKVNVGREGNANLREPPPDTPGGGKVFRRLGPGRAD